MGCIIDLEEFPSVCPVIIEEIIHHILGKCVLKDFGEGVTHAYGVDQL